MEDKPQIIVLYIDRDNDTLHQVLLNPLELSKISTEISNIFAAKKSDVMVSEVKLKLYEEVDKNGKKNSSKVR